jgi:hypothetical protein
MPAQPGTARPDCPDANPYLTIGETGLNAT